MVAIARSEPGRLKKVSTGDAASESAGIASNQERLGRGLTTDMPGSLSQVECDQGMPMQVSRYAMCQLWLMYDDDLVTE